MAAPAVPAQTADDDEVLAEAALLKSALKPWTGDLDGMVARNMIRIAIPYGITTYFLDGTTQKGVTYDLALAFEKPLKKPLGLKASEMTIVVDPTRRVDICQLLPDDRAEGVPASQRASADGARPSTSTQPLPT